jgi:hypothetical protein
MREKHAGIAHESTLSLTIFATEYMAAGHRQRAQRKDGIGCLLPVFPWCTRRPPGQSIECSYWQSGMNLLGSCFLTVGLIYCLRP